ncbi:MAG: sigma-70 family RNA polymerase sigma factor [Burkholderiales bacterium]
MSETTSRAVSEDLGASFARLREALRAYLRRRVRDSAVAEDLLQEIFLKALTALRSRRPPANLTGWLYAVARTTVIDHYRSWRPADETLSDQLPDVEANDERAHQELAACLRPLTEQLPPIYRDALIAADFQGEELNSLAGKHNVSVSAIKSRTSRARAMLRDRLLECCKVEIANGLVTDYRRHPGGACSGKCA